jgi:hypothetical protein
VTEPIKIQDKIATSVGFSGVLLAFLANTIIAIRHDTIDLGLKFLFFLATLCITMNIVLEFLIKLNAPFQKLNTEKIIKISNDCFLAGLLVTAAIIIDILTNIYIAVIFALAAALLLRVIVYKTKIKPERSNTSSKIERPIKKEEMTTKDLDESTL